MLVLAALGFAAGMSMGYWAFVAGLGVALPVSFLLQRWQEAGIAGMDNLTPQQAFNRFFQRSLIKSMIALAVLLLAHFVGIEFLFGVLSGLVLQVMAYMGEALIIIFRKEG